jgi:hypothetical protein
MIVAKINTKYINKNTGVLARVIDIKKAEKGKQSFVYYSGMDGEDYNHITILQF